MASPTKIKPTPAFDAKVALETGSKPEFKYRVGYWWSEKKSQKLNAAELTNLFAEKQCQLVKIDLDRPIEDQGPFALIVHKISDIIVKADQGDIAAKRAISAFESYVRKHPQTVILDPLDNNRTLLDRYKQYRLIEESGLAREGFIFTPPFVHLTSTNMDVNRGRIRRSRITFPLVCKPILAQGSTGAHQMCIIFNEAGLKDIKPPCVAQSFVNHNARLFKLFVIKDKYYIMQRPSLKNFQAGDHETVFFFSHDISKPNSSSSLTELDEEDKMRLNSLIIKLKATDIDINSNHQASFNNSSNKRSVELSNSNADHDKLLPQQQQQHQQTSKTESSILSCDMNIQQANDKKSDPQQQQQDSRSNSASEWAESKEQSMQPTKSLQTNNFLALSHDRLQEIVKIFSGKLGLTFYGIDIIIENETSRYAIIDMNTFPGYDGVDNFLTIFRDVVCEAIPEEVDPQNSSMHNKSYRRKPTEIDSGIEST